MIRCHAPNKNRPDDLDCFAEPGICGDNKWCMLGDRESWNDTDQATRGRCIGFQTLCESCTATFDDDNPAVIPGLDANA